MPIRNGTTPPATKAPVWFTSPDMAEASRLISTCWPRPVSCRWLSAARTPMVACRPEITSNTATPARYGSPSGVSRHAHQPGDGLDDEVVPGQRGTLGPAAETADRGVHDGRVGGRDGVVVELEAGQAARLEVLDEHVGAPRELVRRGQVAGIAQVERDRALVAVDAEVIGRDAVPDRRLPGAGVVAARALDLDHFRAHVGQQHRRVRPGQDPGEVRHQQPGQRPFRLVHRHRMIGPFVRLSVIRTIVHGRRTDQPRPAKVPVKAGHAGEWLDSRNADGRQ